jgi:hypothetical protein
MQSAQNDPSRAVHKRNNLDLTLSDLLSKRLKELLVSILFEFVGKIFTLAT